MRCPQCMSKDIRQGVEMAPVDEGCAVVRNER